MVVALAFLILSLAITLIGAHVLLLKLLVPMALERDKRRHLAGCTSSTVKVWAWVAFAAAVLVLPLLAAGGF